MQNFSVREIAECIKRPHEEMGTVVDRIRGWTDVGLISVLGSKFPGTGSRRRYGPEAIIDAAVLTALTDAGLAAVRVGNFQGVDGQTVLGLGRLGAATFFDPDHANDKIYLVIAGSPTTSAHTTYIAYGVQKQTPIDLSKPTIITREKEDIRLPSDATWSMVLNLNAVFHALVGVVHVVNEGGFIRVSSLKSGDR